MGETALFPDVNVRNIETCRTIFFPEIKHFSKFCYKVKNVTEYKSTFHNFPNEYLCQRWRMLTITENDMFITLHDT